MSHFTNEESWRGEGGYAGSQESTLKPRLIMGPDSAFQKAVEAQGDVGIDVVMDLIPGIINDNPTLFIAYQGDSSKI